MYRNDKTTNSWNGINELQNDFLFTEIFTNALLNVYLLIVQDKIRKCFLQNPFAITGSVYTYEISVHVTALLTS